MNSEFRKLPERLLLWKHCCWEIGRWRWQLLAFKVLLCFESMKIFYIEFVYSTFVEILIEHETDQDMDSNIKEEYFADIFGLDDLCIFLVNWHQLVCSSRDNGSKSNLI